VTESTEPRRHEDTKHGGTQHSLERILVLKMAGIGDLLTALPALEALRRAYPHAEISALVTPQTVSLLEGSGLVDCVIALDKHLFDTAGGFARPSSLSRLVRLGLRLRRERYDAAILMHHLVTWPGIAKYALLMAAIGAPVRAGLDDGRGRFLNRAVPDRGFGAMHEVDYWIEVVRGLGAEARDPQMRLTWGEPEEAHAAEAWARAGLAPGDRVVAIHPGTGSYSPIRRWHPEGFAAVGDALVADGLVPALIAGPDEEPLAQQVAQGMAAHAAIVSGVPTPRHLAALLSRCRLFVGNDSGVMHLAVAAGIPVVAVFGPSNHLAWGPYDPSGGRSRVVRLGLPCSPCLYVGQSLGNRYGCGDERCLKDLPPGMVIAAARELLAKARDERPGK
jgi:ADP-heptose:LPS heptosyltransferase